MNFQRLSTDLFQTDLSQRISCYYITILSNSPFQGPAISGIQGELFWTVSVMSTIGQNNILFHKMHVIFWTDLKLFSALVYFLIFSSTSDRIFDAERLNAFAN